MAHWTMLVQCFVYLQHLWVLTLLYISGSSLIQLLTLMQPCSLTRTDLFCKKALLWYPFRAR